MITLLVLWACDPDYHAIEADDTAQGDTGLARAHPPPALVIDLRRVETAVAVEHRAGSSV